jgi:hypothetical protein
VCNLPVRKLNNDKPLIRAAVTARVQFAVNVAHAASPATSGTWIQTGDISTWQYAVQVPTAVSLSFHATPAVLPEGASLTVRSVSTTMTYGPRDLGHGNFWSRIQPGDTLQFSLSVPTVNRAQVQLRIVSLQAGIRGLGSGVKDQPYYRALVQAAATSGNASCVQNYECSVTSGNTPSGQAALAVVVSNEYQCTGTLINDVPGDNTPYVLTARHCETGQAGGGNPGAASDVTIYWDATTPCGTALGSIYDPGIKTQIGAQTVVEQQDAWLIRLSDSPVVGDAQFAGFDASGGAIAGGYTVHHALGYDKQYTGWFGQAAAVQSSGILGSNFVSNYWEVVNQLGNIAPGASGSGLFDQNNHLVGSLTLGRTTSDTSGYEMCPVSPPATPTGANGVADFTALAAVWSSTADTTSTTGSTTLESVLDPGNTGTAVVPSLVATALNFSASPLILQTGNTSVLSWNVAGASQCHAGGGINGDGWAGTLPASGTQSVIESAGGNTTYSLSCTLPGGGTVTGTVVVTWNGSVPFVQVYAPRSVLWTTRPATITWTSNLTPCSVSGGGLSLSGQSSNGSTTATQNSPADVTYTVSCGTGAATASQTATVSFVTPSLALQANDTDRILGEQLALQWNSAADTCVGSGGAPNDGWDSTAFGWTTETFYPRVTTPGTYTYALTCTAGLLSQSQGVMVTVENNAPYVNLSLSPTTTTFSASPADYITVNWTTNLSVCQLNTTPPMGAVINNPNLFQNESGFLVTGPDIVAPTEPGTYAVSVTCSAVGGPTVTSSSTSVTVNPPALPTASITVTPTTVLTGQQFTVSWSSTNTAGCTTTGNLSSSGFIWSSALASSGSDAGSANEAGQYTVGISCPSIDPSQAAATAQTSVTIDSPVAPSVSISSSITSVNPGQSFTLNWSSSNATACTASGGGATGSPWTGTEPTVGTLMQDPTTVGQFTYTLTCVDESLTTSTSVEVLVVAQSASSSSTHSGGGSESLLDLGFAFTTLLARWARRRLPRRAARRALEPDFYVRDMLTWALTRFPSEIIVPRLLAELRSERAQARSQALHTLSKIKDAGAWPTITRSLLRDADDEVARSAWRAAVALVPSEKKWSGRFSSGGRSHHPVGVSGPGLAAFPRRSSRSDGGSG